MSEFKYKFHCGAGYAGAEHVQEIDLVDDFGYEEDQLEMMTKEDLEDLIEDELREWHYQYVEYWAEKL